MNIDNKAWFTLYQKPFERTSYLYHFTSVEKATLILDGDSLRFSKITSMNDTLEAKPKMNLIGTNSSEELSNIFNCINEINKKYIQLLCFTMDTDIERETGNQWLHYNDYTGRGFALPRMWAQYANNNDGVCFIFNKRKLQSLISDELGENLIYQNKISYISQYSQENNKIFDYEQLRFLLKSNNELAKNIQFVSFLKNNIDFTKHNYFSKLKDWENENEFRVLAYGEEEFYIQKIKDAIVGIVIGEQIKPNNEKIIKMFCKKVCEIKKIFFSYNGCMLKTIYDEDEEVENE